MTSKANMPYSIHSAKEDDSELLGKYRAILYEDLISQDAMKIFELASVQAYKDLINNKEFFGWFIECNDSIVAGAGIIVRHMLLPNTTNPRGCGEAFVVHVYTEPEYRRRGFAKILLQTIIDWCRENKIERITLQSTQEGQSLYKGLGFVATKEMRLDVKP